MYLIPPTLFHSPKPKINEKMGHSPKLTWSRDVTGKVDNRGGVEDTRLEAKAKDTKKIRGQGQPFQGQTLSKPRTGTFEAKAKDQGHSRKYSPKKKVFKKVFPAISNS